MCADCREIRLYGDVDDTMTQIVRSLGLSGIHGHEIAVECFLSGGLPGFDIVGLPDAAVREARERVRAAIKSCNILFPSGRITVNLAPANTKKSGTVYDLPVLLGILAAADTIMPLPTDTAFFGELSLSGELRAIAGALPMALAAAKLGIRRLILPADNAQEASYAEAVDILPAKHITDVLAHLSGLRPIQPTPPSEFRPTPDFRRDFAEVKGQENVKRALEIAVAGAHNVLMSGPPGSGKSMLASRIPSIFPPLTRQEALEVTEIHSVSGLTDSHMPIISERPFRAPHHTVSQGGMAGGGTSPKPGEISLAHNGVLFLDELPEFARNTIEVLRQPLEEGSVTITRTAGTVTYPSRFMLVCAMNPCRCGWFGHPSGRCKCSDKELRAYRARISGPLLDRIDIFVGVQSLKYGELRRDNDAESSSDVRDRVYAARSIQSLRFDGSDVFCNAYMNQASIAQYCKLDEECDRLMKSAFDRLGLTARSYDKVLRVARTIADLHASVDISAVHLAEALRFRDYAKQLER